MVAPPLLKGQKGQNGQKGLNGLPVTRGRSRGPGLGEMLIELRGRSVD
jgi:hypothetical protein